MRLQVLLNSNVITMTDKSGLNAPKRCFDTIKLFCWTCFVVTDPFWKFQKLISQLRVGILKHIRLHFEVNRFSYQKQLSTFL